MSLEQSDERRFAREDPRGFLARYPGPVIIDEVQYVPDLLSYIQTAVDEQPSPGRFILTGSQNLLLMSRVSQSLAGRSGILNLLPFSRAELDGTPQEDPDTPASLFRGPDWNCGIRSEPVSFRLSTTVGYRPRYGFPITSGPTSSAM